MQTVLDESRRAETLPDLLTRRELADYTGIATHTLARWASEGKGPRMTKIGGIVRYGREDVLEWISAQRAA